MKQKVLFILTSILRLLLHLYGKINFTVGKKVGHSANT